MQKNLQLKEDEEIIAQVRPYFLVYSPKLFLGILFIAVSFFLLFPLFYRGFLGVIIFFILFCFGVFYTARTVFVWQGNVFIITNKRLIDFDQKGFFTKVVSEASLEKVQDVSYSYKGFFQTLLKYGKIEIQTSGTTSRLELVDIKNPNLAHEVILEQIRDANTNNSAKKNDPEKLRDIIEMLKTCNEEDLSRVLNFIKEKFGDKKFEKMLNQDKKEMLRKIYAEND